MEIRRLLYRKLYIRHLQLYNIGVSNESGPDYRIEMHTKLFFIRKCENMHFEKKWRKPVLAPDPSIRNCIFQVLPTVLYRRAPRVPSDTVLYRALSRSRKSSPSEGSGVKGRGEEWQTTAVAASDTFTARATLSAVSAVSSLVAPPTPPAGSGRRRGLRLR